MCLSFKQETRFFSCDPRDLKCRTYPRAFRRVVSHCHPLLLGAKSDCLELRFKGLNQSVKEFRLCGLSDVLMKAGGTQKECPNYPLVSAVFSVPSSVCYPPFSRFAGAVREMHHLFGRAVLRVASCNRTRSTPKVPDHAGHGNFCVRERLLR